MPYSINKTITPRKEPPLSGLTNMLILIFAVPVIIIAMISLALYMAFLWIKALFIPGKNSNIDLYHQELELFRNDKITVMAVDDELDVELMKLNERWKEFVDEEDSALYRVTSIPVITGLQNSLCCFYCKETPGGLILQVLSEGSINGAQPETDLVFLDFTHLHLTHIAHAGTYFLYNDEKDPELIKGFNKDETVTITIHKRDAS